MNEIADAYDFRLVMMESVAGHEAYVIDGEPRPGYEPKRKEAKFLPKFRFRAWIDKATSQWLKLDIQCIDTVSVGLFLVRVHKGSNIQIEQTQVNDEVWLPKHVFLKLDARIALFKGINMQEDVTYRDYRKFRADTKIVPAGESGSNSGKTITLCHSERVSIARGICFFLPGAGSSHHKTAHRNDTLSALAYQVSSSNDSACPGRGNSSSAAPCLALIQRGESSSCN